MYNVDKIKKINNKKATLFYLRIALIIKNKKDKQQKSNIILSENRANHNLRLET